MMDQELAAMPLEDMAPEAEEALEIVPVPSSLVPHLSETAVLLDIDGTLLDLMPTPREVWVPPGLARTLNRLYRRTGGALALVSGRSLNDIDLIFAPEQFPAVGGHGAEMRLEADADAVAATAADAGFTTRAGTDTARAGVDARCATNGATGLDTTDAGLAGTGATSLGTADAGLAGIGAATVVLGCSAEAATAGAEAADTITADAGAATAVADAPAPRATALADAADDAVNADDTAAEAADATKAGASPEAAAACDTASACADATAEAGAATAATADTAEATGFGVGRRHQ